MIKGAFILCFLGSCATYHEKPLLSSPLRGSLTTPDWKELRLRADALEHPLLRSVPFDDRNGLSPDEAAILAVLLNPELRALRDRRGIAASQLLQAGILPNPRLSFGLGKPVGGNSGGRVLRYDLGLKWDLTPLLSRNLRMEAARRHAASVDLLVGWQEWQVAQAARLHAYRVLTGERRLRLAEEIRSLSQRRLEATRKAVALGVKTGLLLSSARNQLNRAQLQVLGAEAALDRERSLLNRSLGLGPKKRIRLESPELLPAPPKLTSKALLEGLEQRRLDLLALRQGYQSQEARVRAAIRQQFPSIGLGLDGGRDTDGVQTLGLGISVALPFFDRNQGKIALERASRKQLRDEYAARVFEARSEILSLLQTLGTARKQEEAVEQGLGLQNTFVKSCRRAVDAGQLDQFAYFKAMAALQKGELERIQRRQGLIEIGIALEIASGQYGLLGQGQVPKTKMGAGHRNQGTQKEEGR